VAEAVAAPALGRLVVVGLGLIGGSFAKGLRDKGLFREVIGVDLDPESRRMAVELGVVDRCEEDLAAACVGADVIQLAVPILAMQKLLGALAQLPLGDAVLTDVGSAKGNVVRAAALAFDGVPPRFVPGHPIAGSEQSGVEASNGQLFRRHKVILTPLADTDGAALQIVDRLWRELGADVEHMEVEHHDEVLAATSGLLQRWGHAVEIAGDGAAALKLPATGCAKGMEGASSSEMPAPERVVPRSSQSGCRVATTK